MPIDHFATYILLGCIVSFAFGLVLGRRERAKRDTPPDMPLGTSSTSSPRKEKT